MTPHDAKIRYPVRLRRSHVLELGRLVGLTDWTVRVMIEGPGAPIKGIQYPGTKWKYFDRDQVIKALFNQPAMAS